MRRVLMIGQARTDFAVFERAFGKATGVLREPARDAESLLAALAEELEPRSDLASAGIKNAAGGA